MVKKIFGLVLLVCFGFAVVSSAATTQMSMKSARIVSLEQCQARLKTAETHVIASDSTRPLLEAQCW
ncbi:MAG: hypothetical protein KA715_03095 [Xanthomonadaceae bacterium]|nr:hypothetical protein [Xanthomonadaceae bacterium]